MQRFYHNLLRVTCFDPNTTELQHLLLLLCLCSWFQQFREQLFFSSLFFIHNKSLLDQSHNFAQSNKSTCGHNLKKKTQRLSCGLVDKMVNVSNLLICVQAQMLSEPEWSSYTLCVTITTTIWICLLSEL